MKNSRTIAPALAVAAFIAYSVILTTSGGALSGVALPLLVAGIGLLVWNAKAEEAGAVTGNGRK